MAKSGGIHLLFGRIGPRLNTDARDGPLSAEDPKPLLCGRFGSKFFEWNCNFTCPGLLCGLGGNKPLGVPTRVVPAGVIGSPIVVHRKLIVCRIITVDIDPYIDTISITKICITDAWGCVAGIVSPGCFVALDSEIEILVIATGLNRCRNFRLPRGAADKREARLFQNRSSRIRSVPSRLLSDVHLKMVFHLPWSRSRVVFGMFLCVLAAGPATDCSWAPQEDHAPSQRDVLRLR